LADNERAGTRTGVASVEVSDTCSAANEDTFGGVVVDVDVDADADMAIACALG